MVVTALVGVQLLLKSVPLPADEVTSSASGAKLDVVRDTLEPGGAEVVLPRLGVSTVKLVSAGCDPSVTISV